LQRSLSGSFFFFSSRRRHTRFSRDWSSDVCSSDLGRPTVNGSWPCRWTFPPLPPTRRSSTLWDGCWRRKPAVLRRRCSTIGSLRSEERRVGKEARARRWEAAEQGIGEQRSSEKSAG